MYAIAESHQLPDTMFTLSRLGDAAIISITAPAILESQATVLGRYLRQLASEVQGQVVLEVAGVGKFNCAWINAMIEVSRFCSNLGGKLFVLGMPKREEGLLRSTGLDRHLTLIASRSAAMRHFKASSETPWRLGIGRMLDLPASTKAA
ncbi:MAG: hypothetical protein HBSAPP03_13710 [Phycisphaerae bacterium]|nr:MAG: hypothetical protein HBSAPP03_13710 [Phycisphaerae bacterium]